MKITPALPNPHPMSSGQDKGGVAAVSAPTRVRDAADQTARRQPATRIVDPIERERLVAQAESRLYQRHGASSLAGRAIASYATVAGESENSGLRDLLGFDAYA